MQTDAFQRRKLASFGVLAFLLLLAGGVFLLLLFQSILAAL